MTPLLWVTRPVHLVFLWGFLMAFAGQEFCALHAAEASTRNVICFGDSITAGYGLENASAESYPALLQQKLDQARTAMDSAPRWRVINAGLSGETTAGGARRIDWVLRQPVEIFILALGGNDGLRGVDPAVSQKNLQTIIDRVRARYPAAKIVLAGMMMPPRMGDARRQKRAHARALFARRRRWPARVQPSRRDSPQPRRPRSHCRDAVARD